MCFTYTSTDIYSRCIHPCAVQHTSVEHTTGNGWQWVSIFANAQLPAGGEELGGGAALALGASACAGDAQQWDMVFDLSQLTLNKDVWLVVL